MRSWIHRLKIYNKSGDEAWHKTIQLFIAPTQQGQSSLTLSQNPLFVLWGRVLHCYILLNDEFLSGVVTPHCVWRGWNNFVTGCRRQCAWFLIALLSLPHPFPYWSILYHCDTRPRCPARAERKSIHGSGYLSAFKMCHHRRAY